MDLQRVVKSPAPKLGHRGSRHMAENYKLLATEVFRQATGVMSEEGSVQAAHDRPSKETPGRLAEN